MLQTIQLALHSTMAVSLIKSFALLMVSITTLVLGACDRQTDGKNGAQPDSKQAELDYKAIEWTDLIPQEDLDALINPPDELMDIEDGSFEDQISNQVYNTLSASSDDRYQQALASTMVIEEMDGQAINLPGFVVPLEFNVDNLISQFFLVPYFGACIHMPPPPPNQMVFVSSKEGIEVEAMHNPIRVYGVLKTDLTLNRLGSSAYSLEMQRFEMY